MTSRAMAAAVWLVALVSLAGGAEGQLVQYTDNATGWTSSESGAEPRRRRSSAGASGRSVPAAP